MTVSLEEVEKKFDILQSRFGVNNGTYLVDFYSGIWYHCCNREPFGNWWNRLNVKKTMRYLNSVLRKKGSSELTIEELYDFYEHTKENVERNLTEKS